MNRIKIKAYAGLMMIIFISIISFSILYINLMNQQNIRLSENYLDDKQAQYIAESYIRALYKNIKSKNFESDDYKNTLEEKIKEINNKNLFPEYEYSHEMTLKDEKDFGNFVALSEIEYKNAKVSMEGEFELFNQLFKNKYPILNEERFTKIERESFLKLKNKYLNSEKYSKNTIYDRIYIKSPSVIYKNSSTNFLKKEKEDFEMSLKKENHYEVLSPLILGLEDSKQVLSLYGTLILKSDIELKTDTILNGILIIDGGNIIHNEYSFRVNGITIVINSNFDGMIESRYEEEFIYKYLKFLPFSYDQRLESITLIN